MKNIKLTNKEIRLIIEGLRFKNSHNQFKSCEEEAILIYKLKDKLESETLVENNDKPILENYRILTRDKLLEELSRRDACRINQRAKDEILRSFDRIAKGYNFIIAVGEPEPMYYSVEYFDKNVLINNLEHDECNKDTIHNKSREDMKSFFRYRNSLKSKVDVNTLKVKVELDTSDIDNKLKDLREKLTSIYG